MKRQRGGARRGRRTERDDGPFAHGRARVVEQRREDGERLRLDVRTGDVRGESGDEDGEDGERLDESLRWRVRLRDRSVVMSSCWADGTHVLELCE